MDRTQVTGSNRLGWWDGYWDGLCDGAEKCASFVGKAALVVGGLLAIKTQISEK